MSTHTSDLNHALTTALHEADAIEIRVLDRASDGIPTTCRAVVRSATGSVFYSAPTATAVKALDGALDLLRAAQATKRIEAAQ
jgi:hypothetical protein